MADKHLKRPRDFSQAAKLVVDIASGQVEDRELTPRNAALTRLRRLWAARAAQRVRPA